MQCVISYKLTHENEVTEVDCLIKLNIQAFLLTRDKEVSVEFLAESLQLFETFLESFFGTTHTYILPHNMTQLLVDRVN